MSTDLFDNTPDEHPVDRGQHTLRGHDAAAPLADRMRPLDLGEFVGQADLLGDHGPLRLLLQSDNLPSLLLWGPPGCGKTTLARLVASYSKARFLEYSAVSVGTKELKAVMADARRLRQATGQRTIMFLDEIHRFNKAQQDALLPWVERGDVTLIGATTENPSFEIISALISRTRLFVLTALLPADIRVLLERSLRDERGFGGRVHLKDDALEALSIICEGDARAALGQLETVVLAAQAAGSGGSSETALTTDDINLYLQSRAAHYDKSGEEHFNIISALHKSMRNSDVNAALYWLTRMLESGEDPLYVARRIVRFASEDIGLAEPTALSQALAARDAIHFLGMPEGALALAQAVTFMSLSPKSNALYVGYQKTRREVERGHNPPVPMHLRNAPTKLMKGLGYGHGYQYAHDQAEGLTAMSCLPDSLRDTSYYEPGKRGFEMELAERMQKIKRWQERRRSNSDGSE